MAFITQSIKGTLDVVPAESHKWQYIERTCFETAKLFGFRELRTPVFEHTELKGIQGREVFPSLL